MIKDVKELTWTFHRIIRFWFLLNFLFGFLWYSSFVINFPRFFKRLFKPTTILILLLRHSQKNYQMWLYKLNLMCEGLSYQIINTSAVNQAVFCWNLMYLTILRNTKQKQFRCVSSCQNQNMTWKQDIQVKTCYIST